MIASNWQDAFITDVLNSLPYIVSLYKEDIQVCEARNTHYVNLTTPYGI